MSATREKLVEQITQVEEDIKQLEAKGDEPTALRAFLVELKKELEATNQTLMETKNLLKG